jgi:hypothetical protein
MTASIPGAADESREEHVTEGAAPQQPASESPASQAGTPSSTVSLMSGTSSDRCQVCSAELTPEQRYCVECGTRRGKPRFTAPKPRPQGSQTALATSPMPGGRLSGNGVIAAAIVIVLLALGVGFLIGDAASSQTVRVTVVGAAASSAKGSSTTSAGTKTAPAPAKVNSTPFAN